MKRFQLLIKQLFPYLIAFGVIFAVMYFGSRTSTETVKAPIMASLDDSSFTVTADQISEAYTLANIANTVSLPSSSTITNNYVDVRLVYEATGTASSSTSTIVEKPTIIDTSSFTRGVIEYTVQSSDTLAGLAAKYGVTKDQIRWSNGMKKETLTAGAKIYIPSVPGIVYKVKKGDTVSGIASKYKSNAEEIIAHNDLETSDISVDQLILLPNGVLPEKERPEYVAPTPKPSTNYNYGSTYVRDSADRMNMIIISNHFYTNSPGNRMVAGQCTWYAWWWRQANGMALPSAALGNARSWNVTLARYGYTVNHTPSYGAVMQSTRSSSGNGHVAIVVAVYPNDHITIREMNWRRSYQVTQADISWANAIKYNFIH